MPSRSFDRMGYIEYMKMVEVAGVHHLLLGGSPSKLPASTATLQLVALIARVTLLHRVLAAPHRKKRVKAQRK